MPALGLPKTVESILATLLDDHSVTSWKDTGEGETPVAVLRFTSAQQDG